VLSGTSMCMYVHIRRHEHTRVQARTGPRLHVRAPACRRHAGALTWRLSLYKILFHCKPLWWDSIFLLLPPPPAKPTLLHNYCTTTAQYTPPPHRLFLLCNTPYNIGDGNIVQRPSGAAGLTSHSVSADRPST